jgi:hypothetical protein
MKGYMETKMKWEMIRPGVYECRKGNFFARIELNEHFNKKRWKWELDNRGRFLASGYFNKLKEAKEDAEFTLSLLLAEYEEDLLEEAEEEEEDDEQRT